MELRFADASLGLLCNSLVRLQQRWGVEGGRTVGRRLTQMRAVPDIASMQMLPGECYIDKKTNTWVVNAAEVAIIRFRPDPTHPVAPLFARITRVNVIEVADRFPKGRS